MAEWWDTKLGNFQKFSSTEILLKLKQLLVELLLIFAYLTG